MKRKHGMIMGALFVGCIMMCMAQVTATAGTAGYTVDPPVIVSVAAGVGSYTHTGGGGVRVVDIVSCATGGTLTAYVDLTGAGVLLKPLGSTTGTAIVATNYVNAATQTVTACRSVDVGDADYVWPKQKVLLSTDTNIATHNVWLILERKD